MTGRYRSHTPAPGIYHFDKDFDLIADVTGQPVKRIACIRGEPFLDYADLILNLVRLCVDGAALEPSLANL